MTAPLDRARALLSLAASSTDEEESRTAAVQAARLISKHGFILQEGTFVREDVNVKDEYGPHWETLFSAVDPEHASPVLFCHAIHWTPTDLKFVAKQNKRISDQKLFRLLEFCQRNSLPFPLAPEHPAWIRLRNIHLARVRQSQKNAANVRAGTVIRRAAEQVSLNITMADVIDLFSRK